jgi:hypothetical protein
MGVKFGLTLREEYRLRVSENSVLRRIFGSDRKWRKLHSGKLHNLCSQVLTIRVNKSRRMK